MRHSLMPQRVTDNIYKYEAGRDRARPLPADARGACGGTMPITVTNLTCVYGAGTPFETTALRDVSVTVENGSFVGILGRTGCGKSTLIQIMAGLLTPTAGTVMLDGQDIHARRYDRSILRRKVGIVFQYPECQLFETTVEKDVAFGLKHSGLSAAEKQARVRWAFRRKM